MERKEYLEERRELVRMEMEAYASLDKVLLAVTSGAIGLSVAIIGKFHHPIFAGLLVLSWLLWLTSIFLQIASFIATSKAMREEQSILSLRYQKKAEDDHENKYAGIPSKLNYAALAAFGIGALTFLSFVIANAGHIMR